MNKLIIICFLFYITPVIITAQDYIPNGAPAIKTFTLQGDMSGAASNSVNLFTGDVALPINLLSLPGHNGLDVSVSISYNSNVQHAVDLWNLESPAGILGLGWSMDIPKIICDNKQTGTREDDEYYLVENGASNQLVRTTASSDAEGAYNIYETKIYQFWKIRYYYDPVEFGLSGSGGNKWVIIKEDGTKYVYGDKNSNRYTIQWMVRWGNWVGNSSQASGQSQFANIWNLSEIINVWNERITFEYLAVEQYVGSYSGKKQTEASYLKTITDVWGRKVSFFYNDKQLPYYMEPHTEKAEPDAYQEYYEKKYLDHIDVLSETSSKLLTVQFGYNVINYGTNAVKMLLTSIVQKNANGNALPGIKFSYYQSGVGKGALNTITYPSGGTITYTYTEKTLSHSNRELAITAPAGYAEPKVWLAEDYAVVAWRQLGSGGSHDDNGRDVKLYVYQWVGEWKGQFLQTISNVYLAGDQYTKDYRDFQVVLEKDFFAVLSRATPSNNNYHLFIRYKDPKNRGVWGNAGLTNDYGEDLPTLLSGTNFVMVASNKDNTQPSRLYTFQGNSWTSQVFDQSAGYHYYTSANNFFISHNRRVNFTIPPFIKEFNFTYLTEDKKWVTRNWGSALHFNSDDPSYWHASNGMAIAMADNNPEFAYRWDITYNNFYKDSKDKNNNDLFGELSDVSAVFIINNSMVGIDGRLARFDGLNWTKDYITSTNGSTYGMYFSYGDDYVVRPTILAGSDYRGGRKVFNPNTLSWEPDVIMDGLDKGFNFANAGIDYYYFGNGFYYRQPSGAWVKKYTYPTGTYQSLFSKGGWPRFQVFYNANPHPVFEVASFKNGEIQNAQSLAARNLLYIPYKFKNIGAGGQTIVTFPVSFSTGENATTLYLNRMVSDLISGSQKDYPVTLITTNDGISTRYITLDYNTATATIDAGGMVAQYNEVTEIPGSNSSSSKPHGYTKTYFYNGLTYAELGVPFMNVELLWNGLPYRKNVYDKDNNIKAYQQYTYQTFDKTLQNDLATKVNNGYFLRPVEERTAIDNIEMVTSKSYDTNTGMLTQSTSTNFDSKGGTAIVYYKYFWQQYDPNRTLNILSPVIQAKSAILHGPTLTYTSVSATTWKSWNNVYAPHKSYSWKKTGSPDFDFSSWSGTGEPAGDWLKTIELNSLSTSGNKTQITEY